MPEVRVSIGGRDFDVACQEGEEHFLRTAAKLLDEEARVLSDRERERRKNNKLQCKSGVKGMMLQVMPHSPDEGVVVVVGPGNIS